jgi:dihydrodipicolinate synthase/N-acetylneuraminate lyase
MASFEPLTLDALRARLLEGLVIPAHPLVLTAERKLDEIHQRELTRHYLDVGAGGLAVGVHTTQFAIHEPQVGLYQRVLELAVGSVRWRMSHGRWRPILVAGIVGRTEQAVREAALARGVGYDAGLLSLAALRDAGDDELVAHARAVAREIPLFGFYLQPAAGGRVLGRGFWRRFCEIEEVVAIKIAPFNRYQTIDVLRAVAESGREREIALYTGNDDNILLDLLTEHRFAVTSGSVQREVSLRMVGGLLGQWAVWTRRAVELLREVKQAVAAGGPLDPRWLTLNAQLTEANAAIFDAANGFRGCIPGIHEALRRDGWLKGTWCLDPEEKLSPGQAEEIERVASAYPWLTHAWDGED